MADADQPLTPLEFVELGCRITEDEAQDLGIDHVIDEARTGVRAALTSIDSAWDLIGADGREVEKSVLPRGRFRSVRYADRRPRRDSDRIRGDNSFPADLTVMKGAAEVGDRRRHRGVVLGSYRFLLFGDEKRDRVFISYSHLTYDHIGYKGDRRRYWNEIGRIDPDVPVFSGRP